MHAKLFSVGAIVASVAVLYWMLSLPSVDNLPIPTSVDAVQRGEYLINAGGCISCHEGVQNGVLSGGKAIKADFGTFYVPNITPHAETGIGRWSGKDFLLAMKHGRTPAGGFYFPAFPYRSYAGMADADVMDIAAYLMTLSPIDSPSPTHETPRWLFSWMMAGWNIVADILQPTWDYFEDTQLQRGAYLTRNLGHCGECHTPRNVLGIPDYAREFTGATLADGNVDAIDSESLAGWSQDDLAFFLFLGMKPDGEYVGGEMEAVIEHNTSKLSEEDRHALAAFLKYE